MNNDYDLVNNYINNKDFPILLKDELYDILKNHGVTIDSTCSLDLLNGYCDDKGIYRAPSWLDTANEKHVLIIRGIDKIPVEEQIKFMEILKYRKVNEFKLEDCSIILTYGNGLLSEEILSICAKV
jgi:hypothetical protein